MIHHSLKENLNVISMIILKKIFERNKSNDVVNIINIIFEKKEVFSLIISETAKPVVFIPFCCKLFE